MTASSQRHPSRRSVVTTGLVGAGLLTLGVPGHASAGAATAPIRVSPQRRLRTMEGWGTALSWGANIIGGWADVDARTEIVDLLFDPRRGLGLNSTRYNIGATENPSHDHMRLGSTIPSFWPERPGEWDDTQDARQRWVLEEAIARGVDRVSSFVSSPHYWWTRSGCTAGAADGGDNLLPEHLDDYAAYLVDVVTLFRRRWDITIDSLTPLNEPAASWWKAMGRQEGCGYSRPYQAEVLTAVGRALADAGLDGDTLLSMPEEWAPSWTLDTVDDYDADDVAAYLGLVSTHSYGDDAPRDDLRRWAHERGLPIEMAEYGTPGDAGYEPQHVTNALNLARRLNQDLRQLQPDTWTIWNAVESIEENSVADTCWGLIHASYTAGTEQFYVAKQYYGFANYVRFIRPGFTLVDIGDPDAVAAYDERTRRLVIVYVSYDDADRTVTFDLSAFASPAGMVKRARTSATENLARLRPERYHHHAYTTTIKGSSITSFEFPGMPLRHS